MEIGDYVISKAGRDKERVFLVTDIDDTYCYLCDGKVRKSDRPKKKKQKHVAIVGASSEFVRQKLESGQRVTNHELRREILKLTAAQDARL